MDDVTDGTLAQTGQSVLDLLKRILEMTPLQFNQQDRSATGRALRPEQIIHFPLIAADLPTAIYPNPPSDDLFPGQKIPLKCTKRGFSDQPARREPSFGPS
jgi:hypothetical protein